MVTLRLLLFHACTDGLEDADWLFKWDLLGAALLLYPADVTPERLLWDQRPRGRLQILRSRSAGRTSARFLPGSSSSLRVNSTSISP
ncbi:hypothetical protein NQZ68_015586 [Dissostichus eleginoides]|nr:hypothetical protein NQZ68_015586 [Dissostichus eleginoides]